MFRHSSTGTASTPARVVTVSLEWLKRDISRRARGIVPPVVVLVTGAGSSGFRAVRWVRDCPSRWPVDVNRERHALALSSRHQTSKHPDFIGEIAPLSGKIKAVEADPPRADNTRRALTRSLDAAERSGLAPFYGAILPRPAFRATTAQRRPA
jgi:hypothetical protein